MPRFTFALLALLVAAFSPREAGAAPDHLPPDRLPEVGRGVVAEVLDDLTVRLGDGTAVRLALVLPPWPPPGQPGWPPLAAARSALARLATGAAVTLYWPGAQRDRHGRRVAHVVRSRDGLWLQEALVAAGLVRVLTFRDERAEASALLQAEARARSARRGLWADPAFAVRRPGTAAGAIGSFQIVEGTVRETAEVRGRVYLNFGADWRTDFTVLLPRGAVERFATDPLALTGRRIRVRGWLQSYNGPLIEVTHPEAVEILPGPGAD